MRYVFGRRPVAQHSCRQVEDLTSIALDYVVERSQVPSLAAIYELNVFWFHDPAYVPRLLVPTQATAARIGWHPTESLAAGFRYRKESQERHRTLC